MRNNNNKKSKNSIYIRLKKQMTNASNMADNGLKGSAVRERKAINKEKKKPRGKI